MSSRSRALAAATITAALVGAAATTPSYADPNNNSVKKLTKAVTAKGVLKHLAEFQEISDEHGNRAAGLPGYDASVDYVVEQLERAGYDAKLQEFPYTYVEEQSELERISPDPRTFELDTDFVRDSFSPVTPTGDAAGTLAVIEPDGTTSGCETSDFAAMADGQIALIKRGGCNFTVKVLNAQAEGAAGVIVWNNIPETLLYMGGDSTGIEIPAFSTTMEIGQELAAMPGAEMRMSADYDAFERTTANVIAETRGGNADNVVMAGAHLDSVKEGAGINDNGSGSAALLEVARKMAKVKPRNKVRFAWWAAEEEGLLGSEHYVAELSEAQAEDLALYLNFDMVASPNYMFGIYDGDNSGETAPDGFIPAGSAEIEDVFEKFYADRGEPFQDSEFSGRSDYGPFIAVGIPSGGLFTGAEGVKTEEEAALYGGVAGESYDPCYHSACDNLTGEGQDQEVYDALREDQRLVGNINVHALDVNADAIATAVLTFAYDTSTVNGVPGHPGKGHTKPRPRTLAHDAHHARR